MRKQAFVMHFLPLFGVFWVVQGQGFESNWY